MAWFAMAAQATSGTRFVFLSVATICSLTLAKFFISRDALIFKFVKEIVFTMSGPLFIIDQTIPFGVVE
jgi:hypothetical protein